MTAKVRAIARVKRGPFQMDDHNFEREKLCYEQNFLQARALNAQMVQLPLASITLTGGLWFGAGGIAHVPPVVSFGLLTLAFISNLCLITVTARIRIVFKSYLEKIEEFYKDGFVNGRSHNHCSPFLSEFSMVYMFFIQLYIAAAMSAFAAIYLYWPFESLSACGKIVGQSTIALLFTAVFCASAFVTFKTCQVAENGR